MAGSEGRRRAAVITPYFVDHDAVGNDVFHSAASLRRHGWETSIFALAGYSVREKAEPLQELAAHVRSPQDLAYFHFSTGEASVVDAVAALPCRKVLKFHNITPPELFSMWSDELAEASRVGRIQLPRVAGLAWNAVWTPSAYNLAELEPHIAEGVARSVVPPFHETDALLAMRSPRAPGGLPRLLTVGRLVQSKGHPFLLRVMRYLVHELRVPAALDIVGKGDRRLAAYRRMLELMVREFALEPHVTFHGEISTQSLAERYSQASIFLLASEHEGFCVPLVEAMAFSVPVVALATSAVPETVGDAGIVWPERDPRRFAVTIARLLRSPEEAQWLGGLGRARFDALYSNASIERRMAAVIG